MIKPRTSFCTCENWPCFLLIDHEEYHAGEIIVVIKQTMETRGLAELFSASFINLEDTNFVANMRMRKSEVHQKYCQHSISKRLIPSYHSILYFKKAFTRSLRFSCLDISNVKS